MDRKHIATHTIPMDDTALREQDATWGKKTDLDGLFRAMETERTSEEKRQIRSIIIDISNPESHGSPRPIDNQRP